MKYLALLIGALLLGGCAKYEYDLVRPEEHARHIGTKVEEIFTVDPLEYHLLTVENRLVMLVYNHTETPVRLLGGKSFLVTPGGESKPLRDVTVAPGSFIKFILPPLRQPGYRTGPTIGFGVGVGSGGHSRSGVGVGVGTGIGDDYYVAYENPETYWEWKGESDVRLSIVYQQDEREFGHEFVIHRGKVK